MTTKKLGTRRGERKEIETARSLNCITRSWEFHIDCYWRYLNTRWDKSPKSPGQVPCKHQPGCVHFDVDNQSKTRLVGTCKLLVVWLAEPEFARPTKICHDTFKSELRRSLPSKFIGSRQQTQKWKSSRVTLDGQLRYFLVSTKISIELVHCHRNLNFSIGQSYIKVWFREL